MRANMAMTHGIGRAFGDAGKVVLTLLGAVIIGGAIPAGWVALAGLVQTVVAGDSSLTFFAVLMIFAGILATYYAIIHVVGRVAAWRRPAGEVEQPRRYNWNRSMRDERHRPPALTMLESVFVWTAILTTAAFLVWFLFFAGSPLPAGA